MRIDNATKKAIKDEFVTSLMNYYKIQESINLREHIADLVRDIKTSQYKEFFRRLSTMGVEYKNGFEKIALVVSEFEKEKISLLEIEAKDRATKLYEIMYQIKRDITDKKSQNGSIEIFESLKLETISVDEKKLFDKIDLMVISLVSLNWIYNHVSFDRAIFTHRVESEYKRVLLESKNIKIESKISQRLISQ